MTRTATAAAIALALIPATGYAEDSRTFVEGVVTITGSGSATCHDADLFCSGTAIVDVALTGPDHAVRAARGVTAALSLGNRTYLPPGGVAVTLDGRELAATLYDNGCQGYGPDSSSGPGEGTIVVERAGAGATATFSCTAVLIERIL